MMTTEEDNRLILLPGLGADERMFAALAVPGLKLVTPRLLEPGRGETLPDYAARTARHLQIGEGDLVGGSSFGSVVAAEIARQRPVRGLILIGGALDASALGNVHRYLSRLILLLPSGLLRRLLGTEPVMRRCFVPATPAQVALGLAMFHQTPDIMLQQGAFMLGSYRAGTPPAGPIWAIHGALDPLMTPPKVAHCLIVPDAGHGLACTHPKIVNRFLREIIEVRKI